jgi:hypothetical protein
VRFQKTATMMSPKKLPKTSKTQCTIKTLELRFFSQIHQSLNPICSKVPTTKTATMSLLN